MTRSKRRINSTGRKRIQKGKVDIRLLDQEPGQPLLATAQLRIGDLGFPESALVVLEGYQRSTSKRFECGTIGHITVPEPLDLTGLDQRRTVLFRVRVIDRTSNPGQVLGSANRIVPKSSDDTEGRRSIFPVVQRDLDCEVWRVEVDDVTPPTLILNNKIPAFQNRVLDNPLLQGVLLPTAFRQVVEFLAANPDWEDPDEVDWKADWVAFLRDELQITDRPPFEDEDEREDWIDAAVQKFCESKSFVARIRAGIESGDLR